MLAMRKIEEFVLDASQANIIFDNIPQFYRDLVLIVSGFSTRVALDDTALLQLNDDTGSNYDWLWAYQNTTAVGSSESIGATSIQWGDMPGTTALGYPAPWEVTFADYANADREKQIGVHGTAVRTTGSNNIYAFECSGAWRDTSAITKIDLSLTNGDWDTGTIATLY